MTCTIGDQDDKITELAKIVNQLTYKIDEQNFKKSNEMGKQKAEFLDDGTLLEEIGANFEFTRQEL